MYQRATAIHDADLDASAQADRREVYYYDASWRLIGGRRDAFPNQSFAIAPPTYVADEFDQFISAGWGGRYIDELLYHRDGESSGHYALTDRNFSVIAMADSADAGEGGGRCPACRGIQ